MRLIESNVEILPQPNLMIGVYRQIERAGRTCYKSEDKITDDSAKEFVDRMIKNGHTAMLEHGTVYLYVEETDKSTKEEVEECYEVYDFYRTNKYSKAVGIGTGTLTGHRNQYYITTNYRVIVENNRYQDFQKYICAPMANHPKRFSVRFTCDRGVSHELVRHKKLCVA